MLRTSRTTRILLEATERMGIPTDAILGPLGLARGPLVEPGNTVSWETCTRIFDQLWAVLGHDPVRLQAVGRKMTYVPAYAFLRWIAGSTISPKALYQMTVRWVSPANFPMVKVDLEVEDDRVVIRGHVPEPYAPSEAFFHLSFGAMSELPVLLGLEPATLVDARATPRASQMVLRLPRRAPLVTTAKRAVLAVARGRKGQEALEEQRRLVAEGFHEVRRARDELRVLLENLPDLVAIHENGAIRFANRALVTALGGGVLVGRPVEELIDAGSRDAFRAHAAGGPLAQVRLRTGVVVELAPVTAVHFDGVPAKLVVGRDVSERDRLRQQLTVADRLASVGVLAAGVAHEINNPLAYVLNNLEVVKKQIVSIPQPAASTEEALATALEGVDRIRFIVKELLSLARGDDGPRQPTDLKAVIDSTLALARVEIAQRAKVETDLNEAPPVLATVPRLAQIVLNLVLNALDAMSPLPPGQGELTVRLGTSPDGRVALEVADNGVGVPPEAQPHLFEPFYTTKTSGRGTGLGLAITQRLVLELDGEITFTTSPGKGTTFRVLLPPASHGAY